VQLRSDTASDQDDDQTIAPNLIDGVQASGDT
jgi:hypothetical protein